MFVTENKPGDISSLWRLIQNCDVSEKVKEGRKRNSGGLATKAARHQLQQTQRLTCI